MRNFSIASTIFLTLLAANVSLAGITVDDGLTRETTLKPGDSIQGRIVLRNPSDKPQEVKVYQTDYMFFADGRNLYGEPGSAHRSNSSWITVAPKQFTIPARDSFSVYYTIQSPKDESLAGTYWSMLMVEPIAEGSLELPKYEKGKVAVGLQTIMRYGIQIVTHIGESGKREIKFADKKLISKDGKYSLQLDIENTGERWVRPLVRVEIYDTQGAFIGQYQSDHTRIYPECSVRKTTELAGLRPGKYNALVVLDNGDDSAWGAQYELDIKQ